MAYRESYAGKINRKLNKKLHVVEVASGRQKADLVLKNATYVNVFCNELSHGDIAVAEGDRCLHPCSQVFKKFFRLRLTVCFQ